MSPTILKLTSAAGVIVSVCALVMSAQRYLVLDPAIESVAAMASPESPEVLVAKLEDARKETILNILLSRERSARSIYELLQLMVSGWQQTAAVQAGFWGLALVLFSVCLVAAGKQRGEQNRSNR